MSAITLSAWERAELEALQQTNDVLTGGKSFIHRSHWRTGYARLVRAGLVEWGAPPDGFSPRRFAGTTITAKGRAAIQQAQS